MNLNKYETEEFKEILDTISENTLKNAGIPKYISAIVYEINEDGTYNVYIPPDFKNVVTNVANKSGHALNIGDSVEICAKNGKLNNAWISVKHGSEPLDPTYENLNVNGELTVGDSLIVEGTSKLEGPNYSYSSNGTELEAGYIHIGTLFVNGPGADEPFHMMISSNSKQITDFYFCFEEYDDDDPTVLYAYCTYPTLNIYYYKSDDSTWEIYVEKPRTYSTISILQFEKEGEHQAEQYTFTKHYDQVSTLPNGSVYVDSNLYPLGSVYITSTNVEPTFLGGGWTLIDKEFAPATGTSGYTRNTTNCTAVGTFAWAREGHAITLTVIFTNKVAIADTTLEMFTINFATLGITRLHTGYYGYTYTDGGGCTAFININATSGAFQTVEVIPDSSIAAGRDDNRGTFIFIIPKDYMLDSACNKFYWKRTS